MSVLSKPYMHDEAAAFAHVEGNIWPDGVVDSAFRLTVSRNARNLVKP